MIPQKHVIAAILGVGMLALVSCRSNTDQAQNGAEPEAVTQAPKYDWTGTYVSPGKGAEPVYTLRLHKRSVDGSYEMQYGKSEAGQTNYHPEYMFDAKDTDSSIMIRFMGSFTAPEAEWPFAKGDTMCILSVKADSRIETNWKAWRPVNGDAGFEQVSKDYH